MNKSDHNGKGEREPNTQETVNLNKQFGKYKTFLGIGHEKAGEGPEE